MESPKAETPKETSPSPETAVPIPAPSPPKSDTIPTIFNVPIKWLVLPLLTLQNAGAVLMMRAVRSLQGEAEFNTQTAVVMQEVFKALACVGILLVQDHTVSSAWEKPVEALKTAIPALLYLAQNNLQYQAAEVLDASTYTVSYQCKIIWTGLLSVLLLRRHLACYKWLGLFVLAGGVAAVNLGGGQRTELKARADVSQSDRFMGLVTILTAACCSSLAGVYFEKILKGVKVSLWTRNLQLAAYSIVTGYIGILMSPVAKTMVADKGFFYGYTPLTWACITMNAFGGLLVGTVIKYADAIMKDVSLGASIVLSAAGSIIFFEYSLSALVAVGMIMVIYSVFLYGGRVSCFGLVSLEEPSTARADEKVVVKVVSVSTEPTRKLGKLDRRGAGND